MNPDGAGAAQSREERIALVGGVLARCKDLGGGQVRIEFMDVNPPPCGVAYATISTEDLPGPFVKAQLVVGLAPLLTGGGRASSSDRRRDGLLQAAGWRIVHKAAGQAVRTLDVDPGDPGSVGDVVDAIESTFAAASASGEPPAPPATWWAGYVPTEDLLRTRGTEYVDPDEPWLEAITEADLRTRLVRLAGSRGGTIVVRATDVAGVQLELRARRRGDRIEIRGRDPMTSWKASWTMPVDAPRADAVLRDLHAAIASRGRGDLVSGLSIRLLQHDEAAAWAPDAVEFNWFFAAVAGIVAVVLVSFAVLPSGVEAVIESVRRGLAEPEPDIVSALPVVLVAFTAIGAGSAAGEMSIAIATRLRLGYSTGAWLSTAAVALATAAYLVLVIAAGESWGMVVGASWAFVVGRWAVRSFRRRRSK